MGRPFSYEGPFSPCGGLFSPYGDLFSPYGGFFLHVGFFLLMGVFFTMWGPFLGFAPLIVKISAGSHVLYHVSGTILVCVVHIVVHGAS